MGAAFACLVENDDDGGKQKQICANKASSSILQCLPAIDGSINEMAANSTQSLGNSMQKNMVLTYLSKPEYPAIVISECSKCQEQAFYLKSPKLAVQ